MSRKKIITLFMLCGLVSFASAQQDSLSVNMLGDVTVTATKTEKKLTETGKAVIIINREQIERSSGKDLAQLLNCSDLQESHSYLR